MLKYTKSQKFFIFYVNLENIKFIEIYFFVVLIIKKIKR